jgi:hypothetical protein
MKNGTGIVRMTKRLLKKSNHGILPLKLKKLIAQLNIKKLTVLLQIPKKLGFVEYRFIAFPFTDAE